MYCGCGRSLQFPDAALGRLSCSVLCMCACATGAWIISACFLKVLVIHNANILSFIKISAVPANLLLPAALVQQHSSLQRWWSCPLGHTGLQDHRQAVSQAAVHAQQLPIWTTSFAGQVVEALQQSQQLPQLFVPHTLPCQQPDCSCCCRCCCCCCCCCRCCWPECRMSFASITCLTERRSVQH